MRFARLVFRIAGIYGLVVLAPGFFLEQRVGQDYPPAVTHPEYYYGFLSVALAWQVLFLMLSRDPVRYRPLMLPSVLEKAGFLISAIVLSAQQRIAAPTLGFALIDGVLGVLFLTAWWKTRSTASSLES